MSDHGKPCWYELATQPDSLDAASGFYAKLFGWRVISAGMKGMDYRLAGDARGQIAGMMAQPCDDQPPQWTIYFAVDDADAAATKIRAAGGTIKQEPADIPGTGRFALVADPQGAVFGLLAPLPMQDGTSMTPAFDQQSAGRGNWQELRTSDPTAALAFYADLFGWTESRQLELPEGAGLYHIFSRDEVDMGGIMGMGNAPSPHWLPYFGIDGIESGIALVTSNGGQLIRGPDEVPGPAWIAICQDPQGAVFALVGPKG